MMALHSASGLSGKSLRISDGLLGGLASATDVHSFENRPVQCLPLFKRKTNREVAWLGALANSDRQNKHEILE